jgi:hypothetical protein
MISVGETDRRVAGLVGSALALMAAAVALEVIAQALSGLSPIYESESALALGRYGALEIVSLCLRGGLTFLLLRALTLAVPAEAVSPVGVRLLGFAAGSRFVIAFVPTDLVIPPHTAHGVVHASFAFAAFFASGVGEILIARRLATASAPVAPALRSPWLFRLARAALLWSVIITVKLAFGARGWGALERLETVLLLGWLLLLGLALWPRRQT